MQKANLLQIACSIIAKTSRVNPADAVLRLELGKQRGLDPAGAKFISDAVFRYYRWRGWLQDKQPLPEQVTAAYEMQARFDKHPASFTDGELIEKSIPQWTTQELEVSPEWVRALQTTPILWLRAKIGKEKEVARAL